MGFTKLLNYFSLLKLIRSKGLPEGRQVFSQNYNGISRHLRERRYLLMTKRGPIEYVFNYKHYLSFLLLITIGTLSSISFVLNFFVQVIKEDLVSSADATPIIVAEFIDYRAKKPSYTKFSFLDIFKNKKIQSYQLTFADQNGKVFKNFEESIFADSFKDIHFKDDSFLKTTPKSNFDKSSLILKTITINYSIDNQIDFTKNKFIEFLKNKNNTIIFTDPLKEIKLSKDSSAFSSVSSNAINTSKKTLLNKTLSSDILNKDEYSKQLELQISKFLTNTSKPSDKFNLLSWFEAKSISKNKESLNLEENNELQTDNIVELEPSDLKIENTKETFLGPKQMPPEVEAYRLLSGFESEIFHFNNLLEELSVSLDEEITNKINLVLSKREIVAPQDPMFFKLLSDRVSLTRNLRSAFNYIPLKSPMEYYYISSSYGWRKDPKTKKRAFHRGIDLAGTWHEDILSPADGEIIFAGSNGGYGNFIKIKHKYGIVTAYGHLQKIFVKKGQKIKIGQKIARMGNTGRSTGQHLHYEIILYGKHVNPINFIRQGRRLLTRNIIQTSTS